MADDSAIVVVVDLKRTGPAYAPRRKAKRGGAEAPPSSFRGRRRGCRRAASGGTGGRISVHRRERIMPGWPIAAAALCGHIAPRLKRHEGGSQNLTEDFTHSTLHEASLVIPSGRSPRSGSARQPPRGSLRRSRGTTPRARTGRSRVSTSWATTGPRRHRRMGRRWDPVLQIRAASPGFFRPIDNGTLNVAKAGSAILMKFSLAGDDGLATLAAGSPSSRSADSQHSSRGRGRHDSALSACRGGKPAPAARPEALQPAGPINYPSPPWPRRRPRMPRP